MNEVYDGAFGRHTCNVMLLEAELFRSQVPPVDDSKSKSCPTCAPNRSQVYRSKLSRSTNTGLITGTERLAMSRRDHGQRGLSISTLL